MRARDNIEKPCGLEVGCPLIDEHRFFAAGLEALYSLPKWKQDKLVAIAIAKWCKRHHAMNVRPNFSTCRDVLNAVVQKVARSENKEGTLVGMITSELKRLEKEQSKEQVEVGADLI